MLRRVSIAGQRQAHSRVRPCGQPAVGRSLVPAMRLVRRRAAAPARRSGCSPSTAWPSAEPPSAALRAQRRPASKSGAAAPRGGEQACAPVPLFRSCGQPVDRQRGKLRLRLDVAPVRRPLEPARAFRPAGRHAGAFQVAAADAVFRLGNPGARGSGQQGKGLLDVPLFDQPHRPSQGGGRRERHCQAVEKTHAVTPPPPVGP